MVVHEKYFSRILGRIVQRHLQQNNELWNSTKQILSILTAVGGGGGAGVRRGGWRCTGGAGGGIRLGVVGADGARLTHVIRRVYVVTWGTC